MTFSPFLPTAAWTALAVTAVAVAAWSAIRPPRLRAGERWLAFLLRLIVFGFVLLLLMNPQRQGALSETLPAGHPVLLLDTSRSMSVESPSRLEQARTLAGEIARQMPSPGQLRLAEFDDTTRLQPATPSPAHGSGSHLGQALDRLLNEPVGRIPSQILVVSDGAFQDLPEITRSLADLNHRGIAVSTLTAGTDTIPPNASIASVLAPSTASASSAVEASIVVEGTALPDGTPLTLSLRGAEQGPQGQKTVTLRQGRAALDWVVPVGLRGDRFSLTLSQVPGELTPSDNEVTFFIGVASRLIRLCYMEGSQSFHPFAGKTYISSKFMNDAFAASGDIECDTFLLPFQDARGAKLQYCRSYNSDNQPVRDASRSLPGRREDWAGYDVIIVSDIDKETFSADQMQWVRDLVIERGGGFCMIGGNFSFDTGQYDKTLWEKLIPVDCLQYGFGHGWRPVRPVFPEAVRDHPILRLHENPAVRNLLLECHPPLLGYHDVRRIKPGAVALAFREGSDAPLIAAQDYGKGRTVAFLSDSAGGWGELYQARWGPPALAEMLPPDAPEEAKAMARDTSLPPNEFYRRFWINTVRWLAEKSARRLRKDLIGSTDLSIARPGRKLPLHAEINALSEAGRLAEWRVHARIGDQRGTRVPLRWDRGAQAFLGELTVPPEVDAAEISVQFDAQWQTQSLTDVVTVPVARIPRELAELSVGTDLMRDIARMGGGKVLTSAAGAAAWLRERPAESAQTIVTEYREPVWNRWWLWLPLVLALLAEWALRRKTLTALAALLFLAAPWADTATAVEPPQAVPGQICVIFGEPGDAEHQAEYESLAGELIQIFRQRFGLKEDQLTVLKGWVSNRRPAYDRAALLETLRSVAAKAKPEAPAWIILLGHSNPTAAGANFNIPGLDVTELDLGGALEKAAGPLVILHTTSSSGKFTKHLAAPGRVVISATLPNEEDNETDFGRLLPRAFAQPSLDPDHDGFVSALELFQAGALTVKTSPPTLPPSCPPPTISPASFPKPAKNLFRKSADA